MDYSKSKLQISGGGKKTPVVKFGASTSSSSSGSTPKKDYKKKGSEQVDFGIPSFGNTGMTGES